MSPEPNTFGKSKLPELLIHHVTWFYKFTKKTGLLDHVYCKECRSSYPSSDSLREKHPRDEYILAGTIKHIPPRRKNAIP